MSLHEIDLAAIHKGESGAIKAALAILRDKYAGNIEAFRKAYGWREDSPALANIEGAARCVGILDSLSRDDDWTRGYNAGRDGAPRDDSQSSAYAFGWHEGHKFFNSLAFRELIKQARKESGYEN